MLPESLLGGLLLVILLAPGFCFVTRRDRHFPARSPGALHETAELVVVSVVCNLTVLMLLGLLRAALPEFTPDIGRLAREGAAYVREEYLTLFCWSAALLAISCFLASLFVPPEWLTKRLPQRVRRRFPHNPSIEHNSSWSELFLLEPECVVYLQCELVDGTLIAGALFAFNPQLDESGDRELVLTSPEMRRNGDHSPTPIDAAVVSIAARSIRYLTVSYLADLPDTASG